MKKAICTLTILTLMLLSIPSFACGDWWCNLWGRDDGDVINLGEVPEHGLPESIKCDTFKCYISGPADFTAFGDVYIYSFDRLSPNRTLELAFVVPPVIPEAPNALSGLAIKGHFLFVVQVNGTFQQVVKINLLNGDQQPYSGPIPDLVPCDEVEEGEDCSYSLPCAFFENFGMDTEQICSDGYGRMPLANSMAFLPDGTLLLSDTFQATIWEIPPGGGDPVIWYQDPEFEAPYGTNGLGYKDGYLYVAVTGPVGIDYAPKYGTLYRIPVEFGIPGDIEVFWAFEGSWAFDPSNPMTYGPDEMSISPTGDVYLTGSLSSKIVRLSSEGELLTVYESDLFENPAGVFFDPLRCSFYTVNHALLFADPHYRVLDVFVGVSH